MTTTIIMSGQSVFDLSKKEQVKWYNSWEHRHAEYEYEDEMRWGSKKWDEDYLYSWEFIKPKDDYEFQESSDDSSGEDSQSEEEDYDEYFDTF